MTTVRLVRTGTFPPCFSSAAQFQQWGEAARRARPGESMHCADCTPQYQSDMIRQGRCAHPHTTFCVTAEGFVEGVRLGTYTRRKSLDLREGA